MVVLGSTFNNFRPPTIMLPQHRLGLVEGQGLDMDLGLQMKDRGMSLEDASKEERSHNLTHKFVEELAEEVLGSNKNI